MGKGNSTFEKMQYSLVDYYNKNMIFLSPEQLKQGMMSGQIEVVNLQIDKLGRLRKKKMEN